MSALLQTMPDGVHTNLCDFLSDSTVGFRTPILTNTCTRECMAIIKIYKEAFEHLKAFAAIIISEQEHKLCVFRKTHLQCGDVC